MIVNDITFLDHCNGVFGAKVFCDVTTKTIHLNSKYDARAVNHVDSQGNQFDVDAFYERNMEQTISHETIHLAILEAVGREACYRFDAIEGKYNLSEYDFSQLGENNE